MINNICRPIILHNRQIPPTKDMLQSDYFVFGEYDGVSIQDNILVNVKENYFPRLWLDLIEETKKLQGFYVTRTIYGFRSEEAEAEIILDKDFHSEDSLPFLFISLFQYKEYHFDYRKLRYALEKAINTSYQAEEARAICYLTLDNSSIILLLKTRTYPVGAQILNRYRSFDAVNEVLDGELHLNYSFTIFGFLNDLLNSSNDLTAYDSMIDEVELYAIETSIGSLQNLKERLEKLLARPVLLYNHLGNDDAVIKLQNILWSELLPLYKSGSGLLQNGDESYRTCTYGITTRIFLKGQEDITSTLTQPNQAEKLSLKSEDRLEQIRAIYKNYREEILEQLQRPKGDRRVVSVLANENIRYTYGKVLLQILNSLEKFERSDFTKYTFASILEPLTMFMKLIYENNNNHDGLNLQNMQGRVRIPVIDSNSGLEFLNAINIQVQNTANVDRAFYEAPDFHAVIYNSPVKLNTFYAAFACYITEIFKNFGISENKNEKNTYKFLICPWLEEQVMSYSITPENAPGDRLILIKVPERLIFHPRMLMIMMTHEIAHFIGGILRNREKRYDIITNILIRSVTLFWQRYPGLKEFILPEAEEEIAKILKEKIEFGAMQFLIDQRRKNPDIDKYRYYSFYIKDEMRNTLTNSIAGDSAELFFLLKKIYHRKQEKSMEEWYQGMYKFNSEFKDYSKMLRDYQKKLLDFEETWNQCILRLLDCRLNFIHDVTELTVEMLSETFVDLLTILILKLKPEDYIKAFLDIDERAGSTMLIIRISLVTKVMRQKLYREKDNRITDYENCWEEAWTTLITDCNMKGKVCSKEFLEVVNSINSIILRLNNKDMEDIVISKNDSLLLFNDYVIWDYCLQYLGHCKKTFERCQKEDAVNVNGKILKFYESLGNIRNIESVVADMEDIIGDYIDRICSVHDNKVL